MGKVKRSRGVQLIGSGVLVILVSLFVTIQWNGSGVCADKIELSPGCYSYNPSPNTGMPSYNDPDKIVLIDGETRTSNYVGVAGWFSSPVEINFNLGSICSIDTVKLYSTTASNQGIAKVTCMLSSDGKEYTNIGETDNTKAPDTYPEPQVIEIPGGGKTGQFLKIKLTKTRQMIQVSEVEVYGKVVGEGKKIEAPSAQAGNLILNGGFEEDTDNDGMPDNWAITLLEGSPVFTLEQTGHSGKRSLSIETKGATECGMLKQVINVQPNTNYTLTFWFKMANTTGGPLHMGFFEEKYLPQVTEWTKITMQKNSGGNSFVEVGFDLYHRTNKVWLDDIEVVGAAPASTSATPSSPGVERKLTPEELASAKPNLVEDSDFEVEAIYGAWVQTTGRMSVDGTTASSGRYSMSFSSATPSVEDSVRRKINVRLVPGKTYTLSCDIKTDNVNDISKVWGVCLIPDGWAWEERVSPSSPTSDWARYSTTFTLKESPNPGIYHVVLCVIKGVSGKVWFDAVKLEEGDKATAYVPDTYTSEFYYYKSDAYISPDMPVIFALGARVLPKNTNIKMILDLPQGIDIGGLWYQPSVKLARQYKKEEIKRGDGTWTRHTIMTPGLTSYPEMIHFFLTTNLKLGEKRKGYYFAKYDQGEQPEQEVTFTSVAISNAPAPKRFYTGIVMYGEELCRTWPNFFDNYKRLGMNLLPLSDAFGLAEPRPSLVSFVEDVKKNGLWVNTWWAPFVPEPKEPDAQAVDIGGNKLTDILCPSYRGKLFQEALPIIRNVAKHGVSWGVWDQELGKGIIYCFCQRCKEGFKAYLAQKYPTLTYTDPQTFENQPENQPDLHKAWVDYKTSLVAEWYSLFAKEFKDAVAKEKVNSSPEPMISAYLVNPSLTDKWGVEYTLADYSKLVEPLDTIEQDCYMDFMTPPNITASFVAKRISDAKKQAKDKAKVIAVPSSGELRGGERGRGGGRSLESIEMKYEILEAATSGAIGFEFYKFSQIDGLDFKYIAEAVKMVSAVEDIILDGKPTDKVKSSNLKVTVRAIEHGKEAVIFASEYSKVPVETTIEYRVGKPMKVIDVNTGKVIAEISPEKSTFIIKLDKERARLFKLS